MELFLEKAIEMTSYEKPDHIGPDANYQTTQEDPLNSRFDYREYKTSFAFISSQPGPVTMACSSYRPYIQDKVY